MINLIDKFNNKHNRAMNYLNNIISYDDSDTNSFKYLAKAIMNNNNIFGQCIQEFKSPSHNDFLLINLLPKKSSEDFLHFIISLELNFEYRTITFKEYNIPTVLDNTTIILESINTLLKHYPPDHTFIYHTSIPRYLESTKQFRN